MPMRTINDAVGLVVVRILGPQRVIQAGSEPLPFRNGPQRPFFHQDAIQRLGSEEWRSIPHCPRKLLALERWLFAVPVVRPSFRDVFTCRRGTDGFHQ